MTPVHIHLMLNHLPLFATVLAILLLAFALFRDVEAYKKLAYVILLSAALVTPVVFFSGGKSEDRVEHIPGIFENAIEEHEESGEGALVAMSVVGVLAFLQLCLYLFPDFARLRRKTAFLVLAASAIAFGLVAHAANEGGKIRHGRELGAPAPTGTGGGKSED
jgi:glucan phosphoethanolaminetransferase (alkaline phosphatase superfamily)